MASPPTSSVRFISGDGAELHAPQEWTPCQVEINAAPDRLAQLRLSRNGEDLELAVKIVDGEPRVFASWTRAGAGHYEIEVADGDAIERTACKIVPEKLSSEAFRQLLIDVQQRLPATIAIALQKAGALAGLQLVAPQDTTIAEELARLTRACEGTPTRVGLTRALQAVSRAPHQVLDGVDVWTRRERARRIDPAKLHQAYARRDNLTDGVPLKVPERRVQHIVDVYENRLLQTYHQQLDTRLRSLCKAARSLASEAVSAQAETLLEDLSSARRDASFLNEVSNLQEPPSRLTMVLLRRSEYRAALEGFLEFRRSALVQLDEPLLASPLENLPALYEAWGTLEVIASFVSLAQPLGYRVKSEQLVKRRDDRVWIEVLKDGRVAAELEHRDGQVAKLIPQRSYPASKLGLHSVSFRKVPDVAIEVTDPLGRTRITIFDPKYKLESEKQPTIDGGASGVPKGAPKPQDINAMHAYRDAIRDADGDYPVRYAAIMYPGPTTTYGSEVAALQSHPLKKDALGAQLAEIIADALRVPGDGAISAAA